MAKDDAAPASETVDPQAGEPVEQVAVTGRPADEPLPNSTFGSRSTEGDVKAVTTAENKSVSSKRSARK